MVLQYLNHVFLAVFTVEAAIKIIALKQQYFKQAWNLFDFSLVALTYTLLILQFSQLVSGWSQLTNILRCLRIGRVLRLVKKVTQLQLIFHTLMSSAASLGSLGLLLLLFFFIFAVIGMHNFGYLKIGAPQTELNVHANF